MLALAVTLALVAGSVLFLRHARAHSRAPETTHRAANLATPPLLKALSGVIESVAGEYSRFRERVALDAFVRSGQPLYCGGSKGRYVALTFDDGPGAYSELALRILRREHVKATFFLVGWKAASRSELAIQESETHVLGSHSWSHVSLPPLSTKGIERQIVRSERAIARATGERVRLFRPPYGDHDLRVDRIARREGLLEVLWSIDSRDSQGANWRQVGRNVLRDVRPGSIILLHDNRGQALRALRYIILPGLARRGYVPVTVPELLVLDPPPTDGPRDRCG